jgi:hypothetical protein
MGKVSWNGEKDKGVEIEIGDKSKSIIGEALETLDKQKKVTEDFVSLFEKFVPEKFNATNAK